MRKSECMKNIEELADLISKEIDRLQTDELRRAFKLTLLIMGRAAETAAVFDMIADCGCKCIKCSVTLAEFVHNTEAK